MMNSSDSFDEMEPTGKISLSRATFEWTITNFSNVANLTGILDSPVFTVGAKRKYEFKLKIYNGCYDEESRDFLSLYLQPLYHFPCLARVTLYAMNSRGEKVEVRDSCSMVELVKNAKWGFKFFLRRSNLAYKERCLPNDDTLRIFCEMDFDDSCISKSPVSWNESESRCQVLAQYEQLLLSGEFSDIQFFSKDGQLFRAHRSILAAGSPVFSRMFQQGKGKVEIALGAKNSEVLREVLLFIYVGRVDHMDQLVNELLFAAHKFGLNGLKKMCAKRLSEDLTAANAIEYLKVAHRIEEESLRAKCMEFIVSNGPEIARKYELHKIATLETDIIIDMFRVLLTKN